MIELENQDPEHGIINDGNDEETDTKIRDFFYQKGNKNGTALMARPERGRFLLKEEGLHDPLGVG